MTPHPGGLPRPPRRRGPADRRDDGARRRRGPPGRPRRRHRRRPRAGRQHVCRRTAHLGAASPRRSCARSRRAAGRGARRAPRVRGQRARAPSCSPTRRAGCGSSRAADEEAAERLAAILREEQADVLLTYDRNGGYGHRDHVKVHQVGARAAELAGTPRVLQATVPRDTICRAIELAAPVYRFPPEFDRDRVRARLQRRGPRSPTASACAGMPSRSGPRCAPTPPRPPPTAGPTARWRPSCASRVRCSTSSSGGSGTSTPPRPAGVARVA